MLTNKQLWRKQRPLNQGFNLRRSFSDDSIKSGLNSSTDSSTDSEATHRNSSCSFDSTSAECSPAKCSPDNSSTCSKSVDGVNLSDSPLRKKKKLRFDTRVRVTLIPTIAEYKDAGLNTFLWCSPTELQSYKFSAFEDVKDFMRESHCDNFTQAMKSLLQVDNTAEATTSAAAHSKVAVAPTVKKISNSEASTETDDVKADHACNAVHMPKG